MNEPRTEKSENGSRGPVDLGPVADPVQDQQEAGPAVEEQGVKQPPRKRRRGEPRADGLKPGQWNKHGHPNKQWPKQIRVTDRGRPLDDFRKAAEIISGDDLRPFLVRRIGLLYAGIFQFLTDREVEKLLKRLIDIGTGEAVWHRTYEDGTRRSGGAPVKSQIKAIQVFFDIVGSIYERAKGQAKMNEAKFLRFDVQDDRVQAEIVRLRQLISEPGAGPPEVQPGIRSSGNGESAAAQTGPAAQVPDPSAGLAEPAAGT